MYNARNMLKPESGRIVSLDVLRGIAILGILLANIAAFHYPVLMSKVLYQAPTWKGVDLLIEQFTVAFVNGKFRGMLCILFGAGMYIQFQNRTATGDHWPGGYLRRTVILFAIGCVHGIFIWFGDILAVYALTALLSFWVVKLPTATLWKVVIGLGIFAFTCGLGIMSFTMTSATETSSLGEFSSIIGGEAAAYKSGTYGTQLLYRSGLFLMTLLGAITIVPILGGLFILGVILARENMFRTPSSNPRLRNGLLVAGLGIGLPLNAGALFITDSKQVNGYQQFLEMGGGALLSVGYIILVLMALEGKWAQVLFRPLQNVGKIALTTYLSQSIICTTIFYSCGFGLFNSLTRTQLLYVVGGVWLFNLIFAAVWLRFFRMGPVECLWRSWSDKVPFDLQRQPKAALEPPPVAR